MRGLFLLITSAAALTPTTRRAWTQGLVAGTATIATAATAEGPPGGFKAKPVEQPTSKVNINTSQAPAYMDCPGMYGMRRGIDLRRDAAITFDGAGTRRSRPASSSTCATRAASRR